MLVYCQNALHFSVDDLSIILLFNHSQCMLTLTTELAANTDTLIYKTHW